MTAHMATLFPEPKTDMQIMQYIRAGLPMASIKQVQGSLSIDDAQPILDLIGMSTRTYQRRLKDDKPLNRVESDRLYRLIKIEDRATQVFQDGEIAADWLRTDNRILGDTPMNLLDTEVGVDMVERVLDRIEYGVFS